MAEDRYSLLVGVLESELRAAIRRGRERALLRLVYAWSRGVGVKLTADEVAEILDQDDALHTRAISVVREQETRDD